ncbi:MAG: molecular chaperone DnaJ [Alphaproteobacteria bacterium]
MPDYYKTLGVDKSASDADLKAAYRKKAMEFHPDRNKAKDAEAKFKDINEAYDVLKDPQKKAAYDRMGHSAFTQNGGAGAGNPFGGGGNPFAGRGGQQGGGFEFNGNMEDLFEDILGGMFGGGGGQQQTRRSRTSRGADLRYDMDLTLEQAYKGHKTSISFPSQKPCGTCEGNGAKKGTKPTTCESCHGSGNIQFRQGFFSMSRTCGDCGGTGQMVKDKCPDCKGSGRTHQTRKLDITIPAGVETGTRLRLQSEGEAGTAGGPAGDLFVFLSVKPHPLFERQGPDLMMDVPLSVFDALLGTELNIPTLDGQTTKVKVPENTSPDTLLRVRGKGMSHLNNPRQHGDLLLNINVVMPDKLSKEHKHTLAELRDAITQPAQAKSFLKKLSDFWSK